MGCGCKNKNQGQPTPQPQSAQPGVTTQNSNNTQSIQSVIKKTVEKYYKK